MVRCFTVSEYNQRLLDSLGNKLDRLLCDLQDKGWTILHVVPVPCKQWDYPKYHDSVCYNVIAKIDDAQIEELEKRESEEVKSDGGEE